VPVQLQRGYSSTATRCLHLRGSISILATLLVPTVEWSSGSKMQPATSSTKPQRKHLCDGTSA
jgi:hypothetical protein